MAGLNETGRQFDITRSDFAPYQALGAGAAPHLGNLVGTNGIDAQMAEILGLKESPLFTQLMKNGTDANLATASATGGLRGGNFQDAQQRFGADTLNSVIANQLANYSGLVGIGSGASGAVGNFGANAVAQQNLLRNQGADALGQAQLVRGGINAKNWQNGGSLLDSGLSAILGGGGGISTIFKSLF
jgi:hypothetical protein